MKSMLELEGIYISGMTPDCTTEEMSHWIVIDDLDLHNEKIAQHQIKTDPCVGLTEADVAEAEELLKE